MNYPAPLIATPHVRPGTSEAPSLLKMAAIRKQFANGAVALDGLDMSVRRGEFLSLLGPSGCGKSTALRLIAGLDTPTAGRLDWDPAKPSPRSIGFVFQEPTLMPWANVFDNVHLPLKLAGTNRASAEPAIMEALEMVDLAGFRDAYPRELSGGMKMRVSIARALVTKPRLLLMDEPFAALDEITRFKLNNDLLKVWQRIDCTIVFVTHSVYESVFLSSRILIFRARPGRIFAELRVDPSLPRDEAFRTSADYVGICRDASQALASAMVAG